MKLPDDLKLCHNCGAVLIAHNERAIGCCTECIRMERNAPLPRPMYNVKDKDNGDN